MVAMVVVADIAVGSIMVWYTSHHKIGGDYDMSDHIIKAFDDDLLVLGSSVALNSIDTKAVGDSLGIKAYNGGSNGQNFPFYLSMLKSAVRSAHAPSVVMLGVVDNNLSESGAGPRYNLLAPYYGHAIGDIDSVMNVVRPYNSIFLKSKLYRFNQAWFRILLYHFMTPGITGECGFIAKNIPAFFPSKDPVMHVATPSAERLGQLREFVDICRANNIKLIVFIPPYYAAGRDNTIANYVSNDIELWDDAMMPRFNNDSTLFYDNTHLNINGARIYTDTVIKRLKYRL